MNAHKADLKLAKAVLKGDESAFNRLFEDNHPKLFRFILSRTGQDHDLAHDLAQDTLCKVMDKLDGYRGEASLFTWMCQISRSLIHAHFVKHKRRSQVVVPMADTPEMQNILENTAMQNQPQPEQVTMNQQLKGLLEEILDHLPNDYGHVLTWKYMDHLSVHEIAHQLNTSQIAVQSILARARKAFQKVISSMMQHDHLRDLLTGQQDSHHG